MPTNLEQLEALSTVQRSRPTCSAPAHPHGIVVGQQRALRLGQLAQLHGAQRKQVAALLPRQPLEQVVGAVRLVGAVVARGQQEQVGLRRGGGWRAGGKPSAAVVQWQQTGEPRRRAGWPARSLAPTSEGNWATRRSAKKAELSCRPRERLCCTQATRCSSSAAEGGPRDPCIPAGARSGLNEVCGSDRLPRGAPDTQINDWGNGLVAACWADGLLGLHRPNAKFAFPGPSPIWAAIALCTFLSSDPVIGSMVTHASASCGRLATRPSSPSQQTGMARRHLSTSRCNIATAPRASVNVQPFGSPPPATAAAAAAPDMQALQQQLEGAAQRLQSSASGVQLPDVRLPEVQLPTSVDTQQAASVAAQVGWVGQQSGREWRTVACH